MHSRKDSESADTDQAPEVVVTVSEESLENIKDITACLKRAGLEVENVLDFIGQVTGRCSASDIAALREVEGVADVSVSRRIQLPPPDSIIQ